MSATPRPPSTSVTQHGVPHVLRLEQCSPERAAQVGGKVKGLHALIELGLPVPGGFAITADAYRRALAVTGAEERISGVISRDDLTDAEKSACIFDVFTSVALPEDLVAAIDGAYAELGEGPVAVRSSGIAEDTAAASFAGQHDTYLWIQGAAAVREHVLRCWASLYNAGAIGYRARFDIPPADVAMGVVVQRMVPAAAGGVMMTLEPVTGDRRHIYIESAHGLGEGVVVGDVHSDQYWVDKATMTLARAEISNQVALHAFDEQAGRVTVQGLDPAIGSAPSLTDDTALALARLGRDIENAFGAPMDVEWALSPEGEVLLLQARPETVWSNRGEPSEDRPLADPAAERVARPSGGTTMHGDLNPEWYYSTANLGEAAPGVLAPLTWSVWGPGAEIAARYAFVQMGVLEASKAGVPDDPHEWFINVAFGRAVASVSAFYQMGDRIPGSSGDAIAAALLGSIPEGMTPRPTKRRWLWVAARMPRAFIRAKRVLANQHTQVAAWWTQELERTPRLDLAGAQEQFLDACRRFQATTALQAQGNLIGVPPVYEQLEALVKSVGMEESFGKLTAGAGDHAETEVVADLWDLAKGGLSEKEFLARHGYHGTMEGDIAGIVWREDPTPIRRLAGLYRDQDDTKDPRVAAEMRAREREQAEAELLSRVRGPGRAKARLILHLARRNMPMRGIGKASFLRSLDIARASARRIGTLLVEAGLIDEVDDVMYLTADEISATIPANARELIRERRSEHAIYRTYELPIAFWGEPDTVVTRSTQTVEASDSLTGIGVSAGVVEGVVRVVTDPSFAEVEPGEILVAATTDPSWASIMFVSSALVVDIGGALSHAAVVARELGIPCVVNTGNGTRALRNGDVVRVDGRAGTVDVIHRTDLT
jgi:phosphohistidine swiveling domain-containing protein